MIDMKDKVYVFSTYRQATYEWKSLLEAYPDFFIKASRTNLSLTSIFGKTYYFTTTTDGIRLKGLTAEWVYFDEFVEEDIKNELLQLSRKSKATDC